MGVGVKRRIVSKEKRVWMRIPLAIPVFVRGKDKNGREFLEFTCALDLSAGGILLASKHRLARRGRVSIEVPVPPMPKLEVVQAPAGNTINARPVRVAHANGMMLYGMKFARPVLKQNGEVARLPARP